jgi:hypothetical protein
VTADRPAPEVGTNVNLNAGEGTLHLFDPVSTNRIEW